MDEKGWSLPREGAAAKFLRSATGLRRLHTRSLMKPRYFDRPALSCCSTDAASPLRSLRLSERFVGVFAPRDAVALVASRGDLEALFVTAREHLAPGAAFAFDLSLPPPRWLFPDEVDPHEGVQPERAVFTPHLESRRTRQGHRDIHRLLLRHFTAGEVDHALAAAGLEALSRDRDFEGRPWEPGSDRMVVVAQAQQPASRG